MCLGFRVNLFVSGITSAFSSSHIDIRHSAQPKSVGAITKKILGIFIVHEKFNLNGSSTVHSCVYPGSPRLLFGIIHVKDSLLPWDKVWSLDFLGISYAICLISS